MLTALWSIALFIGGPVLLSVLTMRERDGKACLHKDLHRERGEALFKTLRLFARLAMVAVAAFCIVSMLTGCINMGRW